MTLHLFFQNIISSVKKIVGIVPPEIKPDETTSIGTPEIKPVETTSIGTSDINPGETIDLNGVGDQHSGDYYVDEVSHTVDANGYRQRFDLDRNATGDPDNKDSD